MHTYVNAFVSNNLFLFCAHRSLIIWIGGSQKQIRGEKTLRFLKGPSDFLAEGTRDPLINILSCMGNTIFPKMGQVAKMLARPKGTSVVGSKLGIVALWRPRKCTLVLFPHPTSIFFTQIEFDTYPTLFSIHLPCIQSYFSKINNFLLIFTTRTHRSIWCGLSKWRLPVKRVLALLEFSRYPPKAVYDT